MKQVKQLQETPEISETLEAKETRENLSTNSQENGRERRYFWWIFGWFLGLKFWLAAAFPFTGDEAFFYQWGVFPDWGYYDHPPMVGWMLAGLRLISDHPLALRLVTVFLWHLIALGLVDLLFRYLPQEKKSQAYGVGVLFLALPFTWALNLVTTDTPLILFIFTSAYCFIRSQFSVRWMLWSLGTGIFLGLALLSKYFAGFLAVAYVAASCRTQLTRKQAVLQVVVIAVSASPFFLINLAYNATHCWNNVMFNLVNRHEGSQTSLATVFLYLSMLLYLVTPWVAWHFWRQRLKNLSWGLVALFVVPFVLFLCFSVRKTIGLHWVLGFMPFVFLAYGLQASAAQIKRDLRWTLILSVPHFLALVALIALPASVWSGTRLHADVVFHRETGKVVAQLKKSLPENAVLAAFSYTPAALLAFHAGHYVPVLGVGKYHARQDDILVDFRVFDGRAVRVFDRRPIALEKIQNWFESVRVGQFVVDEVTFYFVDGFGFKYENFRAEVLQKIFDQYYQLPSWLPSLECQFTQRYGFFDGN